MLKNISKEWLFIIGLALIKLLLHLLTNTNYELHRDAFLYYSLGEHMDWGYLSVPPFIAIISKIAVFLFGHTTFALRFFPALIGSISVIVIAKIVKELNGGIWAIIIAAAAFILSPAFLRSNTLFQPVSFNQFFWLLSGYFIVRLIKTNNPKQWIWLFIVFGFGFLNKYSIAFFIVSFLLALLITEHRVLLKSKYFFIGGFIAFLIILPNLIWQYNHNWPLISHMKELRETQLIHVSITGFVIDQLLMNLPALIIWLAGLIIFLFYKAENQFRVLSYTYLFTLIMLIALSGKSYYALGLYPILFAMGGYAIDKYFRPFLKYSTAVFLILLTIPMLPYSLPLLSFEKMEKYSKPMAEFTNRWEDGTIHNLPQDYADMTGWKELADIVLNTYDQLPEEQKKNCTIYAEEYCTAGAIFFYGKEAGLPEPVCFNASFLLWAPDSILPENFIYINNEIGDIEWLFGEYTLKGQVINKFFRENGVQVYLCHNPVEEFPQFYMQKVAELKRNYSRQD